MDHNSIGECSRGNRTPGLLLRSILSIFGKKGFIMLQAKDLDVLDEFASRIRAEFSESRIWAFGSRARGEGTWESDLDVCVVLNRMDSDIRARISEIAWEVGFERDLFISTVAFSKQMFEEGPPSAGTLVKAILKEGIAA